jgi:UDP-glucose 4-epimerase
VSAEAPPAVVLGASGFIGRALCRRLEQRGLAVRGYSSRQLDLRDAGALAALDGELSTESTVFVLAALTPDRGQTLASLADNLAMMLNLARYLEIRPVGCCIYFSSDAVYPMVDTVTTEQSAVDPSGLYALAKYSGERMLQAAADKAGSRLLVLRPTAVYGPGDTHNSYGPNRFVRSIIEAGSVRLFGGGEELRDHVFVDDVAAVAVGLADAEASGTFNVATGTSRTFASIVDDLGRLADRPFTVEHAPRTGPITHRRFDIARLRAALPDLAFTPFEHGLAETFSAAMRRRR